MQFMKVLLSLIALFSSILVFSQDGKWCKTDQIIKEQKASNVKFEELLHSSLKNAAKKKLNNEAKGVVIVNNAALLLTAGLHVPLTTHL